MCLMHSRDNLSEESSGLSLLKSSSNPNIRMQITRGRGKQKVDKVICNQNLSDRVDVGVTVYAMVGG